MKKVLSIVLALAMVFALVACGENSATQATQESKAATDLQYIKEKGTLIIGITDFAPMDYKAEGSSEWIGFDADLAKKFAESIGVKAEFIEIDWDNKALELKNKNIDLIWNGMTITDELKASMDISNPYCNNAQIIVVKQEKVSSIKNVEDAKNLSFAVETGSAGEEVAKAEGFKITSVPTQADAVKEVAAGTSDACVIDSLMAAAMVGEGTSYPNLAYVSFGLTEEFYGVGGRLGSDVITALNDFFSKAYADGTITAIGEQYKIQASLIKQK